MPIFKLYEILTRYGRLKVRSDDGTHYAITLYGPGDAKFHTGRGSYHGALIELYDELQYNLMVATRSIPEIQ